MGQQYSVGWLGAVIMHLVEGGVSSDRVTGMSVHFVRVAKSVHAMKRPFIGLDWPMPQGQTVHFSG